jgi:serine/threonine protein kinase
MSPELASGRSYCADRRTDIYSLGVIFYEMLTGRRPFRGTDDQLIRSVLYRQPKRPRRVDRRIPSDLEAICLEAMAKEPSARYETALTMGDDLGRALAGQPVRARRPPRWTLDWRRFSRRIISC